MPAANRQVQFFLHIMFSLKYPSSLLAPCKGIRIAESRKFLLVESGILGFGIRNLDCGIRNPANGGIPLTRNPESTARNPESTAWNPESTAWNPESTAWNPESKTVLDYLTWGVIAEIIRSFRKDDGDGNENGKKAISLDKPNNSSAIASWFFVHFFAVTEGL